MKNMVNTDWRIFKVSDIYFEEKRFIYHPGTFVDVLSELYEKFGQNLIIDFDRCEIIIYDDYIE